MHISIWEHESFFAPRDVIIIGGGLAGLWCAYELLSKYPSLKLLILDKGTIPSGASTRNAGFACFGSPTELIHDAKMIGEERMWQLTEMRYKGIQKIRRIFGDNAISYDDCGGYECLRNDINNIEEIDDELSWLNKGLQSITGSKNTFTFANESLTPLGLYGFDTLIENKCEGGLHSGKLVMALQEKVRSLGGQMLYGVDVERWEDEGNCIHVFAKQNISIKTTKLIICTNALNAELLPDLPVTPARGQVLVTSPIEHLNLHGTFHFDQGFYYFRNIGNRVLLGGARNKAFAEESTTEFAVTEIIQDDLEAFLRAHILPKQSFEIEYRWSGIMGFTENKQPLIKQLTNHVTAVIICNGMGVALSPVVAEQIQLEF